MNDPISVAIDNLFGDFYESDMTRKPITDQTWSDKLRDLKTIFIAISKTREAEKFKKTQGKEQKHLDKLFQVIFLYASHYISNGKWSELNYLFGAKEVNAKSPFQLSDRLLVKFLLGASIFFEEAWIKAMDQSQSISKKNSAEKDQIEYIWHNYVSYCSQLLWLVENIEKKVSTTHSLKLLSEEGEPVEGKISLAFSYLSTLSSDEVAGYLLELTEEGFYNIAPLGDNRRVDLESSDDNNNSPKLLLPRKSKTESTGCASDIVLKFYSKIENLGLVRVLSELRPAQQMSKVRDTYERATSNTPKDSLSNIPYQIEARIEIENTLFRCKTILDRLGKSSSFQHIQSFYYTVQESLDWYASISFRTLNHLHGEFNNIKIMTSPDRAEKKREFLHVLARLDVLVRMLAKHNQTELAIKLVSSIPDHLDEGLETDEAELYFYPLTDYRLTKKFKENTEQDFKPHGREGKKEKENQEDEKGEVGEVFQSFRNDFRKYQTTLSLKMTNSKCSKDVFNAMKEYTTQVRSLLSEVAQWCNTLLCLDTKTVNELRQTLPPSKTVQKKSLTLPHEPPCTFEIFGMGSISRDELNLHSDLDIGILIEDGQMYADTFFRALYGCFETYIALIGQGHGGFSLDSGDKSFLFSEDHLLINSPTEMALKLNPIATNIDYKIPYSAQRAVPIYASQLNSTLFLRYQEELKRLFEFSDQDTDDENIIELSKNSNDSFARSSTKSESHLASGISSHIDQKQWILSSSVFDENSSITKAHECISGHYFVNHKDLPGYNLQTFVRPNDLKEHFIAPITFWLFDHATKYGIHKRVPKDVARSLFSNSKFKADRTQILKNFTKRHDYDIKDKLEKNSHASRTDSNNDNIELLLKNKQLKNRMLWLLAEFHRIRFFLHYFSGTQQDSLLSWSAPEDNQRNQIFNPSLVIRISPNIESFLENQFYSIIKNNLYEVIVHDYKSTISANKSLTQEMEYLVTEGDEKDFFVVIIEINSFLEFISHDRLDTLTIDTIPSVQSIHDGLKKLNEEKLKNSGNENNESKNNLKLEHIKSRLHSGSDIASRARELQNLLYSLIQWSNPERKSFLRLALDSRNCSVSIIERLLTICKDKEKPSVRTVSNKNDQKSIQYDYWLTHKACRLNSVADRHQVLPIILKHTNISLDEPDTLGQTIYHLASQQTSYELFAAISSSCSSDITLNKHLSMTDSAKRLPIHYASTQSSLENMYWLATQEPSFSSNVNAADYQGNTPLFLAAMHGRLKIFEFLLDKGADPNHVNRDNQTIFHMSAMSKSKDQVHYVLNLSKNNVKVSVEPTDLDKYKRNPLHYAIFSTNQDCIDLLAQKSLFTHPDTNGRSALHIAVYTGNLTLVKKIVEWLQKEKSVKFQYNYFTSRDKSGNNILHVAASKGDKELYLFLKSHSDRSSYNLEIDKRKTEDRLTPIELLKIKAPLIHSEIYGQQKRGAAIFAFLFNRTDRDREGTDDHIDQETELKELRIN